MTKLCQNCLSDAWSGHELPPWIKYHISAFNGAGYCCRCGLTYAGDKDDPNTADMPNSELAERLRTEAKQDDWDAFTAEAIARILEAVTEQRHSTTVADSELRKSLRRAPKLATPSDLVDEAGSAWDEAMIGEVIAKLSQRSLLLFKVYGMIQSFLDPEGRPPADTGEFREMVAVGEDIARVLGIQVSYEKPDDTHGGFRCHTCRGLFPMSDKCLSSKGPMAGVGFAVCRECFGREEITGEKPTERDPAAL